MLSMEVNFWNFLQSCIIRFTFVCYNIYNIRENDRETLMCVALYLFKHLWYEKERDGQTYIIRFASQRERK